MSLGLLSQEINFLPLADRKLAQFPANGLVGITIYERKKCVRCNALRIGWFTMMVLIRASMQIKQNY